MKVKASKWINFRKDISQISLPERFTFPFYYQPHPLAKIAAEELKLYIENHTFHHDFGYPEQTKSSIGKMFGVLVVQNNVGELGYLAAFSGKIADSNDHEHFVPPVFDMLNDGGFFRQEEKRIVDLNTKLHQLLDDPQYQKLRRQKDELVEFQKQQEAEVRAEVHQGKLNRNAIRKQKKEELTPAEFDVLKAQLAKESINSKLELKQLLRHQAHLRKALDANLEAYDKKIGAIKDERIRLSNALQDRLFDSYQFLNTYKETKSLVPIFEQTALKKPPAGAGECAAPKLLQYAFEHELKPICMAEFWWGSPPNTSIRTHGNYYPACQGKCEPILGHMLKGIELDENPLTVNYGEDKVIETIFEDEYILVINKPHELLSVPGKEIEDSVYSRLKKKYPEATGPLIVHRLDMSTSGLMILAKNEIAYKLLQKQFLNRSIRKTYTALLDGEVDQRKGMIELPMRLDVLDRPRQIVCREHGKRARTDFQVDFRAEGKTRIILKPITGRTHQLRVHAAHQDGLNAPILGDDLYGKAAERLYLHATKITFTHPKTEELVSFTAPVPF